MSKRKRMDPAARAAEILGAAMAVAARVGWTQMTRAEIAAEAECSEGLVTARLGEMSALRRQVMRRAVADGNARVVLQGLAVCDPVALRAPTAVKRRAMAYARGGR